jgi:hypothetical protein
MSGGCSARQASNSSRRLKKPTVSPALPGAPRRTLHRATFSLPQKLNVLNRASRMLNFWRGFSVRQDSFKGRTATQSAVRTSSPLGSLRPCCTNCLSILPISSVVLIDARTTEFLRIARVLPEPLFGCPKPVRISVFKPSRFCVQHLAARCPG